MKRIQTVVGNTRLPLKLTSPSGARSFVVRLALGIVTFSPLFNPLIAQSTHTGPDLQDGHRPAYRLRGSSLAALRSMPLIPAPVSRSAGATLGQAPARIGGGAEFAAGRILIAFQDGTSPAEKQDALNRTSRYLQFSPASGSPYFDIVTITGDNVTVADAVQRLNFDPRVRIAEPDYVVHTQEKIPNDEFFRYLWGLQNLGQGAYGTTGCKTCSKPGADISAAKAWDLTTGSSQAVVAVIDSGVDYNHPDLADNILRDVSGKVVGYDYVNKDDDPMDDFGHGTHTAGTIGAVGNNGVGVAGVCWNAKIMPLKFIDSTGGGYTSDAVSSIDFAVSHGAHILSNSWGGRSFSQLLLDAIRRAEKAGVLFVAAAGNYGENIDPGGFYPASYNRYATNVISVAATDGYDVLASFSDYGPKTCDIAAPGVSTYSTLPSGTCPLCSTSGYGHLSGTSMATPHVAGAAALIKSLYPAAAATELRARLLFAADHPAEMEGYSRRGRLNVFSALQPDTVPPGSPAKFSIAQASATGLRLTWTAAGDDGSTGIVSSYQISYNTIPDAATAVVVEPNFRPGPPGTEETLDLTGLVPNTTYYVSIRAIDKVGNTSPAVSATPVLTGGADFFDGAEATPLFGASGSDPAWVVSTDDAHTGGHSYASPANLATYQRSTLLLTEAYRVLGPSAGAFWVKTDLDSSEYFAWYLQDMSTGRLEYHFGGSGSSAWTQVRFSMSAYAGRGVKIGIYVYRSASNVSPPSHRIWVDDIAIVRLAAGWTDDVEGTAQFTGFSSWSITSESGSSPSHAWSDSPGTTYANNIRLPLMQNTSVTPPGDLGSLSLGFKAKLDLEASRDYLEVYASGDDGAVWEYLGALTGTADWTAYSYDLPAWKKVRVLFFLVTNEVIAKDGVYLDDIGVWGESFKTARNAPTDPARSAAPMAVPPGGADSVVTRGDPGTAQSGYAKVDLSSGGTPYGTAVLSLAQGGVVVSEAAVGASPPSIAVRMFIDYRTGVVATGSGSGAGAMDIFTGLALVNPGSNAARVTYTLRDQAGAQLALGNGNLSAGAHSATFIHQLKNVAPDFSLPPDFPTSIRFGSLEIGSDQPLSITALRLTANQRGDLLLTSTPVADLGKAVENSPLYFPQLVDGGGYATTVVLLNTSNAAETGTIALYGDDGTSLSVTTDSGVTGSSFPYSIPPGGTYVFQTNGAPAGVRAGSVQVTPTTGSSSPEGAGIFSYSQGGVRITESGVPAAVPTTRARIFVDQSMGHDTGLAIASPGGSRSNVTVKAYKLDGNTSAGSAPAPLTLVANGHMARYVGQLVAGLPGDFTGVLDISSSSTFVAVTLRSLRNGRGDVLLTTCPVADLLRSAPAPVVFPHITDGGGYTTQFILLSAGAASGTTIRFYDEKGIPLPVGK